MACRGGILRAGTPAGSCLGPLIFSLFINDIDEAMTLFFVLYADDLVFIVDATDLNSGLAKIDECFKKLREWCNENCLTINESKTKAMLFHKANDHRSKGLLGSQIELNGIKIDVVESFKYLGLIVEPTLTFSKHFKHVESKISVALGKMYSFRRYFSENVVKSFVSCYVISIADYCISIWSVQTENQLEKLQQRINRFLLTYFLNYNHKNVRKRWSCSSNNNSMKPIFDKINLLTIVERRKIALLKFVAKSETSSVFTNWFNPSDSRSMTNNVIFKLKIERSKSVCYNNSIKYAAVNNWNFFVQKLKPQDNWTIGVFISACTDKIISMRDENFVT